MKLALPRRGSAWRALLAGIAVAVALGASCRTAPRRPIASVPALSAESQVAAPAIRVAILTEAARASVGADSGVVVWADGRRSEAQRSTFLAASGASALKRFRVQVASLADEQAASGVAEQARQATGEAASVRLNPETQTHQVRVGGFASRDEALSLAARLARAGLPGAFVAEDAETDSPGRVRWLEGEQLLARALIVPARPAEDLWVDGTPYRGVLEVRPGGAGLTLINVVSIEDYLRGVVANELSPAAFPQIEAQKAQAIAARSYAVRNLGQFIAKGYDICATAACQVYRGRGSEQPLSDQAIAETRGLVASSEGKAINALYTSTCGGHTEDAANVFEGESGPYLRGVPCAPERSAWSFVRTLALPSQAGGEPGLGRDVALLQSLGVLGRGSDGGTLGTPATDAELRHWTTRLLSALHRKACVASLPRALPERGAFFVHLVASLCWQERAERLLAPGDADYLLQLEDRAELVGEAVRLAPALLIQEGMLSPYPDNTLRTRQAITKAEAIRLLAGAVARAGAPGLVAAEFRGLDGAQLALKVGEAIQTLPLDREVRLFRALDGGRFAASELALAAGDRVSVVVEEGRVTFLEAEQSRLGAAADRGSRYYRWEVRMTPAEVARSIARYGDVGAVRDVVPERLGVSGRVVELRVAGSQGDLLLTGLRIRWALGLRENLFVVDRETRADGAVARFVFTGKGWGHGVGLCQVGASGMAQSGATAEAILKHYYTGVSIVQAY